MNFKDRHFFFLLGALLSFLFFESSLLAQIKQWDFQDKDDYQYDPQKIEVVNGRARLIEKIPTRDSGSEAFDRGTYSPNVWAAKGSLELAAPSLYEAKGPGMAAPVGTREAGLMGLWHLDEPSGTNLLDQAASNVAKSSDTEIVSGPTGFSYARRFDGVKSHVFIPHYKNFDFDGPFTLEFWFRPLKSRRDKPETLISRWQTIGAQKGFAVQISPDGKLDFLVSKDGAVTIHHYGESTLVEGQWAHVAAIYTGEDLRLHLNGFLDSEPTPFKGPVHQASNPIYLGALIQNKLDEFFEGVIDEVAFYNRALTETETLVHFGNPTGAAAIWHLNERAGVLSDSSGYGHNLLAQGGPLYEAEGRLGTAIHINVGQYLESPLSIRLASQNELTLESWIKPDFLPSEKAIATFLSSYGGQGEVALGITAPHGRLRAFASMVSPAEVLSSAELMPNVWQHAAASWANGRLRLHINGNLDTTAAYSGFLKTGKIGIRIGSDPKQAAPYQGAIDETALFRRAKNDSEIAASAGLLPAGGTYISSLKDAAAASPWRAISWEEGMSYGDETAFDEMGLLSLYHLNETEAAPLKDEKSSNFLSAVGTYEVPGVFSRGRWFQTPGFDKLISQTILPSLSTFTFSLWFEFANAKPGTQDRLFSIGDGIPTAFRAEDGQLHISTLGARDLMSRKLVTDTAWHMLTLTADGRSLFLYIDGEFQGSAPFVSATAAAPLVLGNLKTLDTFQGAIDEVVFLNFPWSKEKIFQEFLKAKLDLRFLVRSSNQENFTESSWKGPLGPSGLEITPSVTTVGLWHLNDAAFKGMSGEVRDASRGANHGTAYGQIQPEPVAALGGGARFNGSSDYIQIADADNLHFSDQLTLAAWVRPDEMAADGAVILDKRVEAGAPAFSSYALELAPGNRLALRLGHGGGYHTLATERDGEVGVGQWNHVAAVYDGKVVKLFINGKLKKESRFEEQLAVDTGSLYIGRYGSAASRYFSGAMDEIFLEVRALTEPEIAELFAKADPQNYYQAAKLHNLDLEPARYFQYQTLLTSSHPSATPTVNWVEIRASFFTQDKPFIMNRTSVSFAQLEQFLEKMGPLHKGGLSYQISNDGANFYYHNGRRWVIASGAAESNTAAQIQTRVRDFPEEIGIGSFYFKAFLHSPTGLEPAELQGVEIDYLPNKLTLARPNGGEAWLVNSEQTIEWNAAGEVQNVNLEYSFDGFKKDFHSMAHDTPNLGKYSWKLPNLPNTHVKVRVQDALDPRIYDTSDLGFRIIGGFKIEQPNYAEAWEVGSEQEIKWQWVGAIPEVKLEYSTDEFVQAIFPMVDSVKNDGKWKWKIPDHISNTMKVRVSDVNDPFVFDPSNDTFSIVGRLGLVRPKLGERWLVSSEQDILWQTLGTLASVKLEYKTSMDSEWQVIEEKMVNQNGWRWKVPDAIDNNVQIRVTDLNHETIQSTSEPFSIIGGLRLVLPRGSENWPAKSRRRIKWQSIGSVPSVRMEYTTTKEEPFKWHVVEESVPNVGTYIWEVPDKISDSVLVRVSDARDPFVEARAQDRLSVIPSFKMISPNGGEDLQIGSESFIEWKTRGSADKVRVEYSEDGFVKEFHEIIGAASNLGRFTWKVPDLPSQSVKIRVSDVGIPHAQDTSDEPFRIYGGFQILVPKGGEKFEVGSLATLEWTTLGSIKKVKLEYSRDEFAKDARVIAPSLTNDGRTTWTIPDDLATNLALRISDTGDPKTFEISRGHFSIAGDFHLTAPTGGENLTVGTLVPITWKKAGSVPFVRIDYSEDNFEKSFETIAYQAPNTGRFDWTVPNRVGKKFKIRVWDPSDPDSIDTMTDPARIIGGFTIEAPNGGETLFVGDKTTVIWKDYGSLASVKLELSSDNFQRHIIEVADAYENIGRYPWQIPDVSSGLYKLRISDPQDTTSYDLSNSDFRIRSRFSVLSPNGGEGWPMASKQLIRWQSSASAPAVRLEYSTDDFASAVTIAEAAPNLGSYEWVIPDHVSRSVKVRVSDATDPEGNDASDASFRIFGIFELNSPAGGTIWKVGSQQSITWKTQGKIETVRLEYSRDGFQSEARPIALALENSGSYHWTVPDDISESVKVRVADSNEPEVFAISLKPFQIAASFMMLAPSGGEVWHASEKREINWVTIGTAREVNLEYSTDHFASEPTVIDKMILNAGAYLWDIPFILGENFKLRVCDTSFPSVCDESDRIFSVRSPFEVTSPRGGEAWPVGSDQEIRWNTYGRVDRVKVDYSTDYKKDSPAATPWKNLSEVLSNRGHLLFRVPDEISQNVFLRVSDYENGSFYAVSRAPVSFTGTFALLEPNGGEKWAAGTVQKISWDTVGSSPNVRLEYSKDDFQNHVQLIESAFTNTGNYDWKIPSDMGVTIKVRVTDASNRASFDTSDEPFKVMTGFTLTSPNGGEKWIVGTKQKIQWTSEGNARFVRLEYKAEIASSGPSVGRPRNDAAVIASEAKQSQWQAFAVKAPSGGEYEWTLPNIISKNMRLRISDADDADAFDESEADFEIRADILLAAPKGGEVLRVGEPFAVRWVSIGIIPRFKLEVSADNFAQDVRVIAEAVTGTESFVWTPTDDVTDQAKIRVTNLDNLEVSDASDQPFKIVPDIKILKPAADKFAVNSETLIQWDWRGTMDLVKIEYSSNDFVSRKTIAEKAPNTGNFKWKAPDDVAEGVKIKISDANHPEAYAISALGFKILPGFTILSPNGGELWPVGEKREIRWETQGTSNRVRLEYGARAVDQEGAEYSWKPIGQVLRNQGSYQWEVPFNVSSDAKIRVLDALDGSAFDASDKPFKILGRFKILSPGPGDALKAGASHLISWETKGEVPSVKITYSYKKPVVRHSEPAIDSMAGEESHDEILRQKTPQDDAMIEPIWANEGQYYWTVPDAISEKVTLKISDAREPETFALSDPFKIRGELNLILPEGKIHWPIGSSQTLTWETTGNIPRVSLFYAAKEGSPWKLITQAILNTGKFGWTIPDDSAQAAVLKIQDAENPEVFTLAPRPVILANQFEILTPKEGARMLVGSSQRIAWKTVGQAKKIWLEFSSGKEWLPIAGPVPDEKFYEWVVPDTIGSLWKIRVRDGDNADSLATSGVFDIHGALDVTHPDGGDVWPVGSKQMIEWSSFGTIPKVRVEAISSDGLYSLVLANELSNEGRLEWIIPDVIRNDLLIKISDLRDAAIFSKSNQAFSIIGAFQWMSPKSGDEWLVGTNAQLAWSSLGTVSNVLMEYSRDDFYRDINVVAAGVANTGSAVWVVPDMISPSVKLRISDAADPRASAVAGPLKIKGGISLISPRGGEVWTVGDKQPLSWQAVGSIPRVRLEYSHDDFHTHVQVIENELENRGRYEWQIPDQISKTLKLRIVDAADSSVVSMSEPFAIQGALELKSPNGGEALPVLGQRSIVWQTTGSISKVRLEYSQDDFTTDARLIQSGIENKGQFEWTIPDAIGKLWKVRVSDATHLSVADTSDGAFEIHGSLAWMSPSAPTAWAVGSKQEIRWNTLGTIPSVRMEYSKDDFNQDARLVAEGVSNTGSYLWHIPDDISEGLKVRVSELTNPAVAAISPASFRIMGILALMDPAPDTLVRVGGTHAIRWKTFGTIPVVRLEYSVLPGTNLLRHPEDPERSEGDEGSQKGILRSAQDDSAFRSPLDDDRTLDWKLITGGVENTGEFEWTVPDELADAVFIRISDLRDPQAFDISRQSFAIGGDFDWASPRGGERWIVGTSHDLVWKTIGTIPEVRMEYSRDRFEKEFQVITDKTRNTGRFLWQVPDAISDNVQFRIQDARDAKIYQLTPAPMAIAGELILVTKKESSAWKVGSQEKIQWQTIGSIPFVRLEYAVPDAAALGQEFSVIGDQIPNEGEYIWTIPDLISDGLILKISDTRDPQTFSLSSEDLKIQGSFEWLEPAHESVWTIGDTKTLAWENQGTLPYVVLEYSSDGFQQDIQPIEPLFRNQNQYEWQAPDRPHEKIKLRIQDAKNSEVYALTPEIRLRSELKLEKPAPGDELKVGEQVSIIWQRRGSVPLAKLEYSLDAFKTVGMLMEGQVKSEGLGERDTYLWTVPDKISNQVWLKVSDAQDPEVFSISAGPFAIRGRLELISPKGGEIWTVGAMQKISWKASGSIPEIKIEYSRDGFVKDVNLLRHPEDGLTDGPDEGSQDGILRFAQNDAQWRVPDLVHSKVWVRISDVRDPEVFAQNAEPLKIRGELRLAAPALGSAWKVDSDQIISWQTTGTIPRVRLEVAGISADKKEEFFDIIQDQIPNENQFVWRVSDGLPPLSRLRLSDAEDNTVFSELIEPVQILGKLEFLSPDKRVRWQVGSTQKITWETHGFVPQVRLEYSRDGFKGDIGILHPRINNNQSLVWLIPDLLTKSLTLRISDPGHPEVFADTPAPLEIVGGMQLLSPAGGEVMEVGASYDVMWESLGTVPEVRIEYSRDNFLKDYTVIEEKIANTGRYRWRVPDSVWEKVWLRVVDFSNREIFAAHEFPFTIRAKIGLISPQGGEIWKVGEERHLEWFTVGTIREVRVDYSTDHFTTSVPIADKIANAGKFLWRVPDVISDQFEIRVSDPQMPEVSGHTQSPIKIQGSLAIISPNAPEFWRSGTQHPIQWKTSGTMPAVNLEYSTDRFITAMPIALKVTNADQYGWTVPDLEAEFVQFRVSDANDQAVSAMTEFPIEVGGELVFLEPRGSETFRVGETAKILWKSTGSIPLIKLEVSGDHFKDDILVLEPSLQNTGFYNWKAPDKIHPALELRITDLAHPKVRALSPEPFSIAGSFEFENPLGSETWIVGSRKTLAWSTRGSVREVRLEYSTDLFATAKSIIPRMQNTGNYAWDVPNVVGAEVSLRVSDAHHPTAEAITTHPVNIRGSLRLTRPVENGVWKVGSDETISWETAGAIPNVHLDYSTDNFQNAAAMAENLPNSGSFIWKVPDMRTRNLKIRVRDSVYEEVFNVAQAAIEIQGELKLLSPAGGEVWFVGSEHLITWSTSGPVDQVRLEYSIDHFRTAVPVVSAVNNEGEYLWQIPDAVSRRAEVRIYDVDNPAVVSKTPAIFEIRATLTLLAPIGGESWGVGQRRAVTWKTEGAIPEIRLEYSTDDFASDVQMIGDHLPNNGSFYWEIPALRAAETKVRISDPSHSEVYDVSKSPFKVVGNLEVLFPGWGETFQVGERIEIHWRSSPNIANVKLEVSDDDFETTKVITSGAPNIGKFEWNVPDKISENLKIRISDAQNASVFSVSKVPFQIRGSLKLLAPRGGEVWPAGSPATIRWQTFGTIPKVRVEYSENNFEHSVPIAVAIQNTGAHVWNVPEVIAPKFQIRISDAETPSIQSQTEKFVTIVGQIKVLTPKGGERWVVGEERDIRWQTTGIIPRATLEYSKDNFNKDIHLIVSGIPNVGHYAWRVPADKSSDVRIRVRSAEDSAAAALMDQAFQIDYYRIRWMVKDAQTHEHLTGLTLTDSRGTTEQALSSPLTIEYPYGIFTSVWSRPGYGDIESSWLADRDQTLSVELMPEEKPLETVRANFEYDRMKDLMRIKSWYEKEGKTVPAVIRAEVRIYRGSELVQVLDSSNPNSAGEFRMVWDTGPVAGNERYLASVSISTASGRTIASPMSYQLEVPVKEKVEPVIRTPIAPPAFKQGLGDEPIAARHSEDSRARHSEERSDEESQDEILRFAQDDAVIARTPEDNRGLTPIEKVSEAISAFTLEVPRTAAVNETISIQATAQDSFSPVLDLYDANRKLFLRGQAMQERERGRYVTLLPIKGVAFIPGKSVTVSVIDAASGRFQSASIMIESIPTALGLDEKMGAGIVSDYLRRIDTLIKKIKRAAANTYETPVILSDLEKELSGLAVVLTEKSVNRAVTDKINQLAEELQLIAVNKGYDTSFLVEKPLGTKPNTEELNQKFHDLKSAIEMLRGLYEFYVGRKA